MAAAGVACAATAAPVDERAVGADLTDPDEVADARAAAKALAVSAAHPGDLVIGADQVLARAGRLFSKPATPEDARAQIEALAGGQHLLVSAACAARGGQVLWRGRSHARMTMRSPSPAYLDAYVARNWPAIGGSVGAYMIEGEGARLFAAVEGDPFAIQGLPLVPLLAWLAETGEIDG